MQIPSTLNLECAKRIGWRYSIFFLAHNKTCLGRIFEIVEVNLALNEHLIINFCIDCGEKMVVSIKQTGGMKHEGH